MRMRWAMLAAVMATVSGIAAATAFYQLRPLTVVAIQPETDLPIKVIGLGTVEACVLSKIGFKVSGTVIELNADHGDRVVSGQLLARTNASEQRARTARAEAQVASAEAAVQVAEAVARKNAAVVTQKSQTNQRRQSLLS